MDQASSMCDILTVQEVATRLRVKMGWVYGHADELGAYRLGKYLRFSWTHVVERLEHHDIGLRHGVPAQRQSERSQDSGG